MPLPSFLQRKPPPADRRSPAGADGGVVEAARTRARRRLIGAVVLLAVGIVGFPLVFETTPRPIAVDIPIEAPARRDTGKPPPPVPAPVAAKPSAPVVVAEVPADAGQEAPPQAAPAAPAAAPPVAAPPVAASVPPPAPPAKAADAARAKALLEGDAASQPGGPLRFVVQVGAYGDPVALRDARQRVEKLGMKTYTQVIESEGQKRTRVRVGPFASREEADGAAAKLKAAGLPVAVLSL